MGERNELEALGREIRRRELTLVDRHRLVGLERKVASRLAAGQPSGQLVGRLAESLEDATKRIANRVAAAASMTIAFPPELPLSARAEEIKRLFLEHQVLIVSGATGSGKTTQLPKIALAAGYGRRGAIGCSQPRRLAASSMARRVAVETRSSYGRQVGSKTRFEDNTCPETVIKFLTDGMLLAETSSTASSSTTTASSSTRPTSAASTSTSSSATSNVSSPAAPNSRSWSAPPP